MHRFEFSFFISAKMKSSVLGFIVLLILALQFNECRGYHTLLEFSDSLQIIQGFSFNSVDNSTIPVLLPPTQGTQSSGLLTTDSDNFGEMFYWLFRCQNESAPLIVWLEGGPGIPGSFQVFYGMGPYRISQTLEVTLNPESWNNEYHLLFFDNPVGVGYSSVQNNAFVTDENQVAEQLAIALDQVIQLYPELLNIELYLFGESYGGKYVPALASYMLENASSYSWRFSGIGIGDGLVDTPIQITTYADFIYYHGIASLKEKQFVQELQNEFTNAYTAGDYETASNIFWNINYFVMYKNVVNFYNVDCDISCGLESYMWGAYARLLNLPEIKNQLNVPITYEFNYQMSGASTALNADVCKSMASVFPDLLSNYKTLIYQGSLDMIVNAAGGDLWLSQVPWKGMDDFQNLNKDTWFDGINLAGWVRTSSNLTQIVFPNAGHMVTMDQPSRSLIMLTNWIYDIPFPSTPLLQNTKPQ